MLINYKRVHIFIFSIILSYLHIKFSTVSFTIFKSNYHLGKIDISIKESSKTNQVHTYILAYMHMYMHVYAPAIFPPFPLWLWDICF